MQGIPRPVQCVPQRRAKTSLLYFDVDHRAMDGEYYLRGGVAWPMLAGTVTASSLKGFALMAGVNVHTNRAYIFEAEPFVCIDHVLDPDTGRIEVSGLAPWFNRTWCKYAADSYYYHDAFEIAKVYRLQILRSTFVAPKPHFIRIPWADDLHAEHTLRERIALKRLYFRKTGPLALEVTTYTATRQVTPAIRAMMALAVGLERYPYRNREAVAV